MSGAGGSVWREPDHSSASRTAEHLTGCLRLADLFESQFADAEVLLGRCRNQLAQIEEAGDETTKRQIVELLVSRIRVDTEVVDGRKNARLTINYTFTASRDCTDGFSIGTPMTEPYSV